MPALLRPHAEEVASRPPRSLETEAPPALLDALAHPTRDHLIEVLTVDGPSTVPELAHAVERSQNAVRRHLRVLEAAGAVEQVPAEGAGRRGAAGFRATARSVFTDEDWAQLPVPVRRALFGGALERISRHVGSAMATGGFDRADAHVSWVPTSLDEAGHAQIADLLVEVFERVMGIQAASDARRTHGAPRESDLESEVVVLHFLRTQGANERAEHASQRTHRSRQRMYGLVDDLADELPREAVDWRRVASDARELAALADEHRLQRRDA